MNNQPLSRKKLKQLENKAAQKPGNRVGNCCCFQKGLPTGPSVRGSVRSVPRKRREQLREEAATKTAGWPRV